MTVTTFPTGTVAGRGGRTVPAAAPRPPATATTPAPRRAAGSSPVRLTTRGRVVLVLLGAILLAAATWLVSGAVAAAPAHPAPWTTVVVEPGDSLWSIAEHVAPQTDPRVTVARIVAANGLGDSAVGAGQQLRVPPPGR